MIGKAELGMFFVCFPRLLDVADVFIGLRLSDWNLSNGFTARKAESLARN
jgi:hypothetical protein